MNWKNIGINVGTLGIAWLVKRYRNKVPKAVLDALELARLVPPERIPAEARAILFALEQTRVELEMQKLMAAIEKAEKSMRASFAKNAQLQFRTVVVPPPTEETPVTSPGRRLP